MFKIFRTLLLLIILGAIAYGYRAQLSAVPALIYAKVAPCSRPITYSIGSFDERFGISKADFVDSIKQAEKIWETPADRQLFAYQENGGSIKVNLIYDYRQDATAKLRGLGVNVESTRSSYDSLKERYESRQQQYVNDVKKFDERTAAFQARQAEYQSQVEYWNEKGGAPPNQYESLNVEKSALSAEFSELKEMQNDINAKVDEINALVSVLNGLAADLNINVARYNEISTSRGAEFEQGVYERSGGFQKIDIYEFDTKRRLIRVLAHELGHALGLPHITNDTKAIMYELNEDVNETATRSDVAELKNLCRLE